MTDTMRMMIAGGFMQGLSVKDIAREMNMKEHEVEAIIRKWVRE